MKKIFTIFAALLMAGSMMAEFDTWSVVGSKAIMNGTADWAIAETANDMTTEDGVTYTLTVTGKTLEVGTTYEYKYAKGHAWTVSIPQNGNLSLTVTETAVYDIAYTVNVSDKTHSAVATKAGEAGEITHTYSIAGSSADLFGAAWSQTNTATDMTKGEDGIYRWTKEDVTLAAGTIEYKVVVDHAWGEAYPSQNATLVIAEDAAYNVVFTFNPADKAVNATATKTGEEPGPGPEPEGDPATIRVRIDSSVDDWKFDEEGRGVYFYVWTASASTFNEATYEDGWYSYTSATTPFNFIVVNADNWKAIDGYVSFQSVNMEDVTESACYLMKAGEQKDPTEDPTGKTWKCVLQTADCNAPTAIESTAVKAAAEKVIVNGQLIIFRDGKRYSATGMELK